MYSRHPPNQSYIKNQAILDNRNDTDKVLPMQWWSSDYRIIRYTGQNVAMQCSFW